MPQEEPSNSGTKQQMLTKVYGMADSSVSPINERPMVLGSSGATTKLGLKKDIMDRKKKKKDKVNTSTASESSGFRRSQLDAPPNYELMAKFAAEKEW
jgi:hypothetical protein